MKNPKNSGLGISSIFEGNSSDGLGHDDEQREQQPQKLEDGRHCAGDGQLVGEMARERRVGRKNRQDHREDPDQRIRLLISQHQEMGLMLMRRSQRVDHVMTVRRRLHC